MKKIQSICAGVMCLAMLASCSDNGGKALEEMRGTTAADSASYFLGELWGAQYWKLSSRDTVMATPEEKEAYARGLEEGMKLACGSKSRAYVQGMYDALRFGVSKDGFEEEMGVKISTEAFSNGARYAMRSDSAISLQMVSGQLTEITNRLSAENKTKIISAKAKELGMSEIGMYLYKKEEKPGTGANITANDVVKAQVKVYDMNNKPVENMFPGEFDLSRMPDSYFLKMGMLTMKVGGTAEFLVNADTFYNGQAQYYQVSPVALYKVVCTIESAAPAQTEQGAPTDAPETKTAG